MNLLSVRREVGEFRKRYKWMALTVVLVFAVLFGRIVQLSLIDHDRYAAIARENITRTVTLPATRGVVRDVEGRVVATNRPAYDVYLTPHHVTAEDVERIAELLGLDDEARLELSARLDEVPERRRTHQVRFFSDIDRDQLAALETHQGEIAGLDLVAQPVRTYPFGALGAHAIGYLNQISAEELETRRADGYRMGDRLGRTGLEHAWESYLRGRRGYRRVWVDAQGRPVEGAPPGDPRPIRREPVPGRDLSLTLDMELMRIVERAFRGHPSGAVVVVDVRTGAVRALFSKPAYDLGELTSGMSHARYAELRDNPFRPLIDKTIYESYFPGSTFKPVSALAGLQDGILDPNARVECTGAYTLGNTRFRCTSVHGEVDLRESMVQSCNVFFYRLAEQVGIDRLARFAGDFGLGRRTGVGINTEAAGFIPTRAWYEEERGIRFRLGFTLNAAIGQGDTKITLIQLAMAYGAIANGGTLYVPQLVDHVAGPDGTVLEAFEPRVRRRVSVEREHLALVIDGLYGAVNDPSGTAYEARVPGGVPVAGKTGTAQVSHRSRPDDDPERAWYYNRAHAWFAGFAPADDPELAIVVLVEHGGAGGRNAAPIAIQILQEHLGGRGATTSAAAAETPTGRRLARRN